MVKAGILTISDLGSQGKRVDTAGPHLKEIVEKLGWSVEQYEIVPDKRIVISIKLKEWSDEIGLDLILTTGGTGFAETDVTPEATLDAIEKPAPGISEAMRMRGLAKTPMAMLSRGVSGIRGKTLIINLPGSERGAVESIEAVLDALPHALDVLMGKPGH